MNVKIIAALMLAVIAVWSCSDKNGRKGPAFRESLISKGFVDDNTYRVVCRGFPLAGAEDIQKVESAKRAAILNAYAFIKSEFGDRVAPDREGNVEKMDIRDEYVILHFVIKKKRLRSLQLKPGERETLRRESTPPDDSASDVTSDKAEGER